MDTTKDNARLQPGEAGHSNNDRRQHSRFIGHIQARVSRATWRAAYSLEIARQDNADAGHLWRQAGCCIALSFFRMIGGLGV